MFLRFCLGNVLLLVLGLLAAPAARAQQPAPGLPAAAPAAADTSAALRRLFAERRTGNSARIAGAGVLIVLGNYSLAYSKQETTGQRISTGAIAGLLGYEVFALGQALTWRRRYSPAREQALLAALAQGQPLPRWVRRRLKASYFTAPAPAR